MLATTPLGQRFYNWVASQPPDQPYDWQNSAECACARFLVEELACNPLMIALGRRPSIRWNGPGKDSSLDIRQVWDRFDMIAGGECHEDWTYGKLRERIAAQMPECVA
jgi:hypothetical protein